MQKLKYLSHYNERIQGEILKLIENKRLEKYLLEKYPNPHTIKTDKSLYQFVQDIKNESLKKSAPLSKVMYDSNIHAIHNALGVHTFISRAQGKKLKAKNEIRIGTVFKAMPEDFLRMIVVHELAHIKEKEHNKAFYNLCEYMLPEYHQYEFDTRLYLTHMELFGKLY